MARLIETLQFLDERETPGGAAWNMAMDEALLAAGFGSVLRIYRWQRPTVSFGYFLPWEAAAAVAGGKALVRRWTGGGMVEHGLDFTWSLIVPATELLSRMRPVDSYVAIHGALGEALADVGISAGHVDRTAPVPTGGLCFTAPAPGDLLHSGKKIAGAGQRRCRYGLLHQGSICGVLLPNEFPGVLAARLAGRIQPVAEARPGVREEASALVESRYGTGTWLRKR